MAPTDKRLTASRMAAAAAADRKIRRVLMAVPNPVGDR
jgi:hypothetical protein